MNVEPKSKTAEPKTQGSPIIPIYEFVKEDKIQTITRDELAMSIRRESGIAGIRDIPVQYWMLYQILLNTLEENSLNYQQKDIIVQADILLVDLGGKKNQNN